jgi:hypothetical protein
MKSYSLIVGSFLKNILVKLSMSCSEPNFYGLLSINIFKSNERYNCLTWLIKEVLYPFIPLNQSLSYTDLILFNYYFLLQRQSFGPVFFLSVFLDAA